MKEDQIFTQGESLNDVANYDKVIPSESSVVEDIVDEETFKLVDSFPELHLNENATNNTKSITHESHKNEALLIIEPLDYLCESTKDIHSTCHPEQMNTVEIGNNTINFVIHGDTNDDDTNDADTNDDDTNDADTNDADTNDAYDDDSNDGDTNDNDDMNADGNDHAKKQEIKIKLASLMLLFKTNFNLKDKGIVEASKEESILLDRLMDSDNGIDILESFSHHLMAKLTSK